MIAVPAGITTQNLQSVNGSSEFQVNSGDRRVPALVDLVNSSWARELDTFLVPQDGNKTVFVSLDIADNDEEFDTVEVSLFNCPDWDIGPDTITIFGTRSGSFDLDPLSETFSSGSFPTSCTGLVHICLPLFSSLPDLVILRVEFTASAADNTSEAWVHVAEVVLNERDDCPSDLLTRLPLRYSGKMC